MLIESPVYPRSTGGESQAVRSMATDGVRLLPCVRMKRALGALAFLAATCEEASPIASFATLRLKPAAFRGGATTPPRRDGTTGRPRRASVRHDFDTLETAMRKHLVEALALAHGNQRQAAVPLGVSR